MAMGVTSLLTAVSSLLAGYLTEQSVGTYDKYAVATDTPLCSKIGTDTLKANGSAVDAAIAAMFCLGVVSMHSSGIGGGGVMLVYYQASKNAIVYDFRETAPATAYKDMFKGNQKKSKTGQSILSVDCGAFLESRLC